MKNLFSFVVGTLLSFSASAQVLEAKPFQALVDKIQDTEFRYVGHGLIFGFDSIQSCLYVSEDIAIIKNYCYPARPYRARGYTIISKQFGMVELYEEAIDDKLKRDLRIDEFPELLLPYMTTRVSDHTISSISNLIEVTYERYFPGCWSTNQSFYTGTFDVNCSVSTERVVGFDAWALETQAIVLDRPAWLELMKAIDSKLIQE